MRLIPIGIFLILYLVLSVPIMLVLLIFRQFQPKKAELVMLRIVQWAFKVVLFLAGTDITTIGLEKIPADEAMLFVANHQGVFDILIGYSQMKNRTGFISKDSVKKIPLLNWNMMFIGCLFLNREDLKQGLQVIKDAIEAVKDGRSIFIFPEGTRNKGADKTQLLEFHRGSFKIAQRTDCRIVPVSFNNTTAVMDDHMPWIKKTHVVVEYGEPVRYSDLTKEEQRHIDEYFRERISQMVKKNQELV